MEAAARLLLLVGEEVEEEEEPPNRLEGVVAVAAAVEPVLQHSLVEVAVEEVHRYWEAAAVMVGQHWPTVEEELGASCLAGEVVELVMRWLETAVAVAEARDLSTVEEAAQALVHPGLEVVAALGLDWVVEAALKIVVGR